MKSSKKITPMMAQWHACKQNTQSACLLFRMGDFYEAFYDDAELLSKELDLTLTKRQGIPMAGIPVHTIETYVDRLVSKGFKVAVAEQMEDPRQVKGIVKREVVRVVTPGTIVASQLISEKNNNYFASLHLIGKVYGLAFLDLTTSDFTVIETESRRELLNEIYKLRPAEFLSSEKFKESHQELFKDLKLSYSFLHTTQDHWQFDQQTTFDFLCHHFHLHNLDGFGLKGMTSAISASGALLNHLKNDLKLPIEHIRDIKNYCVDDYLSLDRTTQRNLDLTESQIDGSRRNTLLEILDQTLSPMGGRLLRRWIKQPLFSVQKIQERQDAIESLFKAAQQRLEIHQGLTKVRDLERLMMKISTSYAGPKDFVALRTSLEQVPALRQAIKENPSQLIQFAHEEMKDPTKVAHLISQALIDDPPLKLSEGNVFRQGYHKELDELFEVRRNGQSWMINYQNEMRKETGIKTLKVSYNRVFGYYIEVSKAQAKLMPKHFQRRQTLANSERFITPILKEYEDKVINAEEHISTLEQSLFLHLRNEVAKHAETIKKIARAIALLDALHSLADVAIDQRFRRPVVDDSQQLEILGGRHPVIESTLQSETFIPNDTVMDGKSERMFIITGPNMAGKSTYIRQVALLVIMAQIGSFIPVSKAHIGLVDKVFTRVGANDDLSRGQSTFMVEMTEAANILNNATSRSLIILDEIGRGTSTYDGVSIAWSVAEYLLSTPGKQAKTLFATHYWELTQLEDKMRAVVNYHVAIREGENGIVFLHKIIKGSTDKSYGIHVARLAGLPPLVITRAKEILQYLESQAGGRNQFNIPEKQKYFATTIKNNDQEFQLMLFEPPKRTAKVKHQDEILHTLKGIDIESITPVQALHALSGLREKIFQEKLS